MAVFTVGDELPKMGALMKWPHGGNQTDTDLAGEFGQPTIAALLALCTLLTAPR